MLGGLRILIRYLFFLCRSGNAHGLHSPFVFELYTEALAADKRYYAFGEIEKLRGRLLQDKRTITLRDFGAGSRASHAKTRSIASITRSASKPVALGRTLFRLSHHLQCKNILELGTSFGLSTLYLATANKDSKVVTIEGCQQTALVARENFQKIKSLQIDITLLEGTIEEQLSRGLQMLEKLDLVYIDANHRLEPTLNYFNEILPFTHQGTVFVFDDIYWSEEMQSAWKAVCAHPKVTASIDLFHFGLVFFRTEQPKQHFRLRI